MNQPNLFLIGFQKCGSSSLFDFLIQHPEIQGTSKKETFAITDESYEHFNHENSVLSDSFNWSKYLDFNQKCKFYLEGSVCNFYQNTAQSYISKTENAKVIFVVRDPIERFVSTFNYFGGSGIHLKPGTSIESYLELVKSKNTSKEAMNFALEHGKYIDFINQWEALIGAQNVLVLGMKEFTKKPKEAAQVISDFLGINNSFPEQMSSKNKSEVVKNKQLHLFLRKTFGGMGLGKSWFSKIYLKFNKSRPEKVDLPVRVKTELEMYYQNEYRLLKNKF